MSLLLVDDNSLFIRITSRFLASFPDFELVGMASSAEEALSKAEALQPNVILLDLNMPGVSGLDVLPRLRSVAPRTKIIVLTMWDSDVYRKAAMEAGADDFVPKALINSKLVPAIQRASAPLPPLQAASQS